MHHQWLPDQVYFEQQAIPEATVAALQALGHKVVLGGRQGDGHSILVDLASGVAYGANDPRSPDSKVAK